jgi:glutathione S-transferase
VKLYLNKTSPYARLVQIVVHEKGLDGVVERVWVDPWVTPPELLALSPLSKVPVLVARDGLALVESLGICDYLDEIGSGARLMPAQGDARLQAMRKVGLGRGLIDAAFGVTIERRFHGTQNPSELAVRWLAAVHRVVERLEVDTTPVGATEPDLGDLTLAVGLSYVQFRLPEVAWMASAPRLVQWLEPVSRRASFGATAPE